MAAYWEALSPVTKFFYFLAVPATAVLLLQTILTIIGLGGGGADADFDADADVDTGGFDTAADLDTDFDAPHDGPHAGHLHELGDAGFRMFTLRGVVAFFAVFGWTGIVLSGQSAHVFVTGFVSLAAGLAAMAVVAALFYGITKLQSDGTMRLASAVGRIGRTYIRIPAQRGGVGKVQINVQERLAELSAITDDGQDIPTGTPVIVRGLEGNATLIVARHIPHGDESRSPEPSDRISGGR